MKTKFILFLFFVVFVCKSQNVNLSSLNTFEGEPYIAINPTNPKNILVAWMGFVFGNGTGLTIKVKNTFNGGISWGSAINLPHIKSTYKSADVSMAFDATGKLHLTYIDYRQSPDSGGVYYINSTNGGNSFSSPVLVIDAYADAAKKPIDRPWLTVNSNGTKLFVTTKPAPWILAPNRSYLVSSLNGGATWSNFRFVDTTNFLIGSLISAPMAFPCFAGNSLKIMYPSYVASQNILPAYYIATSTNIGGTFNYNTMIASNTSPAANDSAKSAYQLLANPTNSLNLIALFGAGIGTTDLDIFMLESNNGGSTWGSPLRINNDPINNGKMQDLMWGSFDALGNLAITWRDRRNAPGVGYARASEVYGTFRSAGSSTFVPNFKISDVLEGYTNLLNQSGNDFMCSALQNDTIHSVWGSTRDGSLDIWYSKTKASMGITGVKQLITSESFNIETFPNPTKDKLSVKLTNSISIKTIELFNLEGKMILSQQINNMHGELSLKNLAPSIYTLKVSDEKGNTFSKKVVKQ